jgi:hypothetical protein
MFVQLNMEELTASSLAALSPKQVPLANYTQLLKLMDGAEYHTLPLYKQRNYTYSDGEENDMFDATSIQLAKELKKAITDAEAAANTPNKKSPIKKRSSTRMSKLTPNKDALNSSSSSQPAPAPAPAPPPPVDTSALILPAITVPPTNTQRPKLNVELSKALADKINKELKEKRQQRGAT